MVSQFLGFNEGLKVKSFGFVCPKEIFSKVDDFCVQENIGMSIWNAEDFLLFRDVNPEIEFDKKEDRDRVVSFIKSWQESRGLK